MDFVSQLHTTLQPFSFSHYGWTRLTRPLSLDFYKNWLTEGHHATMEYLERHLPQKEDPSRLAPNARSAVVVAKTYLPHPYPVDARKLKMRTALYAQGEDYHLRFKEELELVARALREKFVGHEFLCFTDSSPIMERDLAYRAGLGWIGKNSCLIHPKKGSLFFLGEIYTSLELDDEVRTLPDMCGTCDRCLKACPTGALESPRTLNANKCISYWTIEAKTSAPAELRTQFGDWFFGCDICQTVCPWNEKVFGRETLRSSHEDPVEDLRWLLTASHNQIEKSLVRSPLSRSRAKGLKRNALYVIANQQIHTLRPEVQCLAEKEGPLQELARWTLERLT